MASGKIGEIDRVEMGGGGSIPPWRRGAYTMKISGVVSNRAVPAAIPYCVPCVRKPFSFRPPRKKMGLRRIRNIAKNQ
jgi:hypothetical protein